MGVRGLTTYIAENSELFLKPFELNNCYLVVDGNNIASHLFNWVSKSDSAFGGDYDEYYKTVKDFFNMLKKCKVTPIVLFDGGYEKKKVKTVLSRAATKIFTLKTFCRHFSPTKFFSLFMKQTFFDVMEDLDICCVQCDLEADVEIATIARALNCPVLSYDSDFYIYDVLYIPFSSVHTEIIRENDSDNKVKEYVKCSIYDVNNFLSEFDNLDKSMLPIIATLLGNDYYDSSIFEKFFSHVIISKNKNKSYTQRKIHGVLHWLKKENVESATKLILSHIENRHAEKIQRVINSNIRDYTKMSVSSSVTLNINKLMSKKKIKRADFKSEESNIVLPSIIKDLFCQCRIDKLIMDMIMLRTYFTGLQIENVNHQSSHVPSLRLIATIYAILDPYLQGNPKPLKLYLTIKNHYTAIKVDDNSAKFFKTCNLENILKTPVNDRLKLLYEIAEVNENDIEIIAKFNETWSVFILAFLYWIKKLNPSITYSHIHALILMAISNQVLQKKVGYYRNSSKFKKKKGVLLSELSGTELIVGKEEDNFNKLLECVTMYECLLIQKALIPWRQTTENGRGKSYCISIIHLFACFQSSLYHIMQLNALLNYPLPHLKICDFYSGTLLFNFYIFISQKPQVEVFGLKLLEKTPNVKNLYKYMYGILCACSEKKPLQMKKTKKKKKGKKQESGEEGDGGVLLVTYEKEDDDDDDDDDYSDENNRYALLMS